MPACPHWSRTGGVGRRTSVMVGKGGGTARVMWASAEGPRAVAVTADATILLAALVAALVMASGARLGGLRDPGDPVPCCLLQPGAVCAVHESLDMQAPGMCAHAGWCSGTHGRNNVGCEEGGRRAPPALSAGSPQELQELMGKDSIVCKNMSCISSVGSGAICTQQRPRQPCLLPLNFAVSCNAR